MPACCQGQAHPVSQSVTLAVTADIYWWPSLCGVETKPADMICLHDSSTPCLGCSGVSWKQLHTSNRLMRLWTADMVSELTSLTLELDPVDTEIWALQPGVSDMREATELQVAFGLMTQLQSLKLVVRGDLDVVSPGVSALAASFW